MIIIKYDAGIENGLQEAHVLQTKILNGSSCATQASLINNIVIAY